MTPIDVRAAHLLHRAGFSLGDFGARNARGVRVHVVTAAGPLGSIRVEGASKAEAWAAALVEARKLYPIG